MNAFQSEARTEGEALRDLVDYYEAEGGGAIREAARRFRERGCRRIAFAGMGSSYSAPLAVVDRLVAAGIPAIAATAHKLHRDRAALVSPETLVVAISKSGTTKELLELAGALDAGVETVAIVNQPDSDLAKRSGVCLPMKAGTETQIASKSFVCTLAVLNLLAAELTGAPLAACLDSLRAVAEWADAHLADAGSAADGLPAGLACCSHVDVLACGASFSTAYKSALVVREVPRIVAAAIDGADYAHGWAKTIRPGYLGIVLAPEYRAGTIEERAIRQIRERGGQVILVTGSAVSSSEDMAVLQHPVVPDSMAPLAQAVILDRLIGAMANAHK